MIQILKDIVELGNRPNEFRELGQVSADEVDEIFRIHGIEVREKLEMSDIVGLNSFSFTQAAQFGQIITEKAYPYSIGNLPKILYIDEIVRTANEIIDFKYDEPILHALSVNENKIIEEDYDYEAQAERDQRQREIDQEAFYFITGGSRGDYEDWRESGEDFTDLRDSMGL